MMATIMLCDMCSEPLGSKQTPYELRITHKPIKRTVQEEMHCIHVELCEKCAERVGNYIRAFKRGMK